MTRDCLETREREPESAPNPSGTCRVVWALAALLLTACGSPTIGPAQDEEPGILRVGRKGDLNGTHYLLEAQFDLTGRQTLALDLGYTDTATNQELEPGAYFIAIHPGFRVLQDSAVAEVSVAAELVSDATQDFQILSAATTLVSYQFAVTEGTLSFDAD